MGEGSFFSPCRKQEIVINFSTVYRLLDRSVSQLPGWLSSSYSSRSWVSGNLPVFTKRQKSRAMGNKQGIQGRKTPRDLCGCEEMPTCAMSLNQSCGRHAGTCSVDTDGQGL